MFRKTLWVLSTVFISIPAWSFVEVKMTYTGLLNKSPQDKVYSGSGVVPKTTATAGLGGDLVFILPVVGLNFGMRYENLGIGFSGNGIKFEGGTTRTSAILGWRFVDTLVYFGPVLTYGVSHSGSQIKVTENGSVVSDLTADKSTSYSAGLELGTKLLGFRVGAEAGYINYLWKDLTGTVGTIKSVSSLDMSGSYIKLAIGFGI